MIARGRVAWARAGFFAASFVVAVTSMLLVPAAAAAYAAPSSSASSATASAGPAAPSSLKVWVFNFDPSNGMMYGTAEGQSPATVAVFNGSSGAYVQQIPAGPTVLSYYPEPLGLDPAASKAFVMEPGPNGTSKIGQFSTTTFRDLPSHDYAPTCAAAGPTYDAKRDVVFLNCGKPNPTASMYEYIVNATTLQLKFNVTLVTAAGSATYGPGIDPRNGYAYQPMDTKNQIDVISPYSGKVVTTITKLGYNLESPLFDPTTGDMLAVSTSGSVNVIDPVSESLLTTYNVGGSVLSTTPIWNASELALLVQPSCSGCNFDQIAYLDLKTGTLLGNTTVPFGTVTIAFDPLDNEVWSSNPYGTTTLQLSNPVY